MAAAAAIGAAGCDVDPPELFERDGSGGGVEELQPFGEAKASVEGLDEALLEALVTEVVLRFRTYRRLREPLPLTSSTSGGPGLTAEACRVDARRRDGAMRYGAALDCAAAPGTAPSGAIEVTQRGSSNRIELTIRYHDVEVGEVSVDGREAIVQERRNGGPVTRTTVELVQAGVELDYAFRQARLADGSTVFDYRASVEGEPVRVRLSEPPTAGALAEVAVIGADGERRCEVRNTAWEPGDPARGICDDGTTLGL